MFVKKFVVVAALAAVSTVTATGAHAQWTVSNLHPAGSTASYAEAASSDQQAGSVVVGGVYRASLWSGTAASWIDLSPPGSIDSIAHAISGGQQAGYTRMRNGGDRASLWSGTAASLVDLQALLPPQFSYSYAQGISSEGLNTYVAGYGTNTVDRRYEALLWTRRNSELTFTNLHPAGAVESVAYAISGGQQAGFTTLVGPVRGASLWSGTAASWVNLHPAGSTYSIASAISGGQQAGYAIVGGVTRASLWSGTAASWVNLHPAGSTRSEAYAISGGQQAGQARVGGAYRASLWSGTAASWVDLHALLPAEFSSSGAAGIFTDGVNTYVVGGGHNTLTGRNETLIWTRPNPAPGCLADVVADGLVNGNDFVAFINSFAVGDVAVDPVADVVADGIIDGDDFVAFINAFGAGC